MPNEKYKVSIENRLTSLEVKVQEVIDNHLPHLSSKVDRLTWLLVTTLASAIISLMVIILK